MEPEKKDFLLDEERANLNDGIKYRRLMLEELFKGDMPPDIKDFRVANEIITGQDNATLKQIELRQRNDQHQDNKEIMENAMAFTRNTILDKKRKYTKTIEDRTIDIPKKYIPTDIVDGENSLSPKPLIAEDYMEE